MKILEVRVLFKNGIEKEYCIKDENIDYENVKGLKDFISKAIKYETTGIIELEDLKIGFETIINVSDITAMQFGKVRDM